MVIRNAKSWRLLSLAFLAPLIVVALLGFQQQRGVAREEQRFEEIMATVGEFVRSNRQVFLEGLQLPTADLPADKVVATVNGLPISVAELEMRFGLHKASGLGPQSLKEVFEALVREKLWIREAIDRGLLATDEEIDRYIAQEKKQVQENEEFAADIRTIVESWGLTPEEYWNIYERYNVMRLVTNDKLSRQVLKEYYADEMMLTPEVQERMKQAWEQYVDGLLAEAKVDVNPEYSH